MEELKPCPFCGGKVEWHTAISYRGTEYYIACRSCCCTNFESSIEKAVSKWNARVYPPEVKQAIDRMKLVVTKPEKTDEYHPCGDEFYLVRCPDCGKEFKLLGFKYSTDVRHCGCCGKAFTLDWSE